MAFPRFLYLFNHSSFAQPRHNLVCKVKSMAKEWLYCSLYAMNTSEKGCILALLILFRDSLVHCSSEPPLNATTSYQILLEM